MLTYIILAVLVVTVLTLSLQFVCYLQYKKACPVFNVQSTSEDFSHVYA